MSESACHICCEEKRESLQDEMVWRLVYWQLLRTALEILLFEGRTGFVVQDGVVKGGLQCIVVQ